MELAVLCPNSDQEKLWLKKSVQRIFLRMEKDFSTSGVHKEHSPSYHLVVLQLFLSIKEFMDFHEIIYPDSFVDNFKKIQDYLAYVTKLDGTLPLLGDTGKSNVLNGLKDRDIVSDYWLYVTSNGVKGKSLENNFQVFEDGGVAIYMDRNPLNPQKNIQWMFTSAFHSIIHKHAEDLSLVLDVDKTSYLVDSGKYNYKEKDPFRRFFRSVFAHNTVVIDGKTYNLNSNQIGKAKISNWGQRDDFSYVIGSHELYENAVVERVLIQMDRGPLLIHDKILLDEEKTVSQSFNIGKDVQVTSASKTLISMKSKRDSSGVQMKQLLDIDDILWFEGSQSPLRGWQSFDFNQKHAIKSFELIKRGKRVEFLTLLNINCYKQIIDVKIRYTNNSMVYEFIDQTNATYELPIPQANDLWNFTHRLSLNENEWELFSTREGYRLFRSNLGLNNKEIINNGYLFEFNNKLFKSQNANQMDVENLVDIYSNGYIYISLSNQVTGWDNENQLPTKEEISDFFRAQLIYLNY
jgi:hypothetical protein